AIFRLSLYPSFGARPANPPPSDLARASGADRDMPPDGLRLLPPQLSGHVWRQEWNDLVVVEVTRRLQGDELLFEAQPGPVEKGLHGALGHFEHRGDAAIAESLELTKCEYQPVFFRQPL